MRFKVSAPTRKTAPGKSRAFSRKVGALLNTRGAPPAAWRLSAMSR